MILTEENYYSPEASMEYVSVSQYKEFMGTPNRISCEAAALAKAKGEIEQVSTKSLLIGSYVDEALTGDLDKFKEEHPELFVTRGDRKGLLKSEYLQAEAMIERARKDPKFMAYLTGQHQVIMTGTIKDIPFKIKIDCVMELNGEPVAIVDLKTVKAMLETFWVRDSGEHITWVENWNYDLQGACYQAIYKQNTGKVLPFYLAVISKEKDGAQVPHPRIKIIQVPQHKLDERLAEVEANIWKIDAIKKGVYEPINCGRCDYCADTLPCEVVSMDELFMEV